jgi:hypothetical protein
VGQYVLVQTDWGFISIWIPHTSYYGEYDVILNENLIEVSKEKAAKSGLNN